MTTRDELLAATVERYRSSRREAKSRILDEFVSVTGFHRKHAMRLLRNGPGPARSRPRPARRLYDEAVREAVILLWEASDRVCSKRLRPLLPVLVEAMERHGHLELDPVVRERLLRISAATIDRVLGSVRERAGGRRRRRAAPSAALRRSVPIRTFSDWDDPAPGYVEADLVAHSGPVASGGFVQTLVLTDVATGWTECAPLLFREQTLLSEVLSEVRRIMPFPLLGLDTDNDTVFMNETVKIYCEAAGIAFTRCRPYRKNDQAFVEQKNGAVVRRMVGYGRLEGPAAASALAELYRDVRLFVNFFQPSFKLAGKERDGARVRKRYHDPRTPHQRLLADPRVPAEVRDRVAGLHAQLDPVALLDRIRRAQQRLAEIAAKTPEAGPTNGEPPDLGAFLAGLRHAWKEGEVRPTARRPPPKPRGRRRPDPLKDVTVTLKGWFEGDPALSGRQLLEKLQAQHPGRYPDGLLRTVQRRTKVWRADLARTLVLGPRPDETPQPGTLEHGQTVVQVRHGFGLGSIPDEAISER